MNVLDVYPRFSWWLCGSSADDIAQTRQLLESDAPAAETQRKAFFIVGDAAAFDLPSGTFDQIIICYPPGSLKKLVLHRHTHPWLAPSGQFLIEPRWDEPLAPTEYAGATPILASLRFASQFHNH